MELSPGSKKRASFSIHCPVQGSPGSEAKIRRAHSCKSSDYLGSNPSLINCMTLDRHSTPLSFHFLLCKSRLMRMAVVIRIKGANLCKAFRTYLTCRLLFCHRLGPHAIACPPLPHRVHRGSWRGGRVLSLATCHPVTSSERRKWVPNGRGGNTCQKWRQTPLQ